MYSICFTFILSLRMVKLSTSVNFAITVVIILIWSTFLNIFLQFMRGKRSTLVNFVRNPSLHQQPEETMKKLQRNQGFALKVLQVQFWQMSESLRYVFTSTPLKQYKFWVSHSNLGKIFAKFPPFFDMYQCQSKKGGDFANFLWPSQNI